MVEDAEAEPTPPKSTTEKKSLGFSGMKKLLRRTPSRSQSSSRSTAADDLSDEDVPATPELPPSPNEKGGLPVLEYERIKRAEGLTGSFAFRGTGGRVVFQLDNR